MNLATFVKTVKRRAHIGTLSVTDDQVTQDIIDALNERRFKFWRAWHWDWSVEPIGSGGNGITVSAGNSEFTLNSTIGQILIMHLSGESYYLKPISLKEYLTWKKTKLDEAGTPSHYIRLGRDSSGNLKFKLWRSAVNAVTVKGFGKKRLTAYTLSDIATNTGLEFFPEETHDILIAGVLSDIEKINNKTAEAAILDNKFKNDIEALIDEEQESKPDDQITTPFPRWLIKSRRQRGLGQTVT